jgi:NAD(P)-dependent dehydrogenase (short-subunit alcohol dehydrogenase family)
VLSLFEDAHARFGTIHAVLSNAGVSSEGRQNFLTSQLSPEGRLLPPDTTTLDVNLLGMVYMAKCAIHYFSMWPEVKCQLVMTGSAASFIDTPPLHLYCASKAGILGFMRSLRTQIGENKGKNVTVNMVAPWMTSKFFLFIS